MNQYIGLKIQGLLRSKDLKQQALAKAMGIGAIHLSKKIGNEASFSLSQINKAATFLGVTPEYLRDTSRVFNPGDTIPEDAIAEKPAPQTPAPTDLVELARSMERQAADIARSEMERMKIEMDAIRESNRQIAQIMNEALGKLAYIADVVKDIKDERDGSHDPD